jgi:7,8-dihydropterin-6-yl-methyl-4-(beta-D-ribofuranosyl)aminobenzene 5'-phosphate synthase
MTQLIHRRRFLEGTAALAGVAVAGIPHLGHAQAARITPPVVDRLVVRVVLDSDFDLFIGQEAVKGVTVERVRVLPPPNQHKTLHNEWGLSLHLESFKGDERRGYLLDFGYTPEILMHNMGLLGVDPAKLDGLILSHGHYDHFGGLLGLLKKHRAAMRPDLALYSGGEDNFCQRFTRTPSGGMNEWGALDRREIAKANVKTVLAEKPMVIDGHVFTTGALPRTSFEKVLPNTMVEYAVKDGLGCNASHFTPAELQGKIVPDEHYHEHAAAYVVKDRGLVVFSCCGHAGIINSVRHAQEISGVNNLHALIGGFHLAPAPAAYLAQSIAELKKLDPDVVIPMHCSGKNFVAAMRENMPDKLITSSTGSRYVFGA